MKNNVFYFVTGSQNLYGDETLKLVARDSKIIAEFLNKHKENPCKIEWVDTAKSKQEISDIVLKANNDKNCAGLILWMHTFSPAKMWIDGLLSLNKPFLHLHTQANKEIPFKEIDMDFMNLNQSAHGDREFGFIATRLRLSRKVVTGYFQDNNVTSQVFSWMRVASAYKFSKHLKVVRVGDNMRDVAVTEGDKVEAQIKLGWSVDGYGVGDIISYIDKVTQKEIDALVESYKKEYKFVTNNIESVRVQAKYEIAFERMLKELNASAVTTTFENLYNLEQLPGLSMQRLMGKGYGFAGEGDWKTSALTALVKYMGSGIKGGTSFMEDYTYHMGENSFILGAHMLEICPSIAVGDVLVDVKPLGIGGKADPARLRFKGPKGEAIVLTLVDMGDRFRLIANKIDLIHTEDMPNLPVAQIAWKPRPSLDVSATAWIYAGGAHHSVLSTQVSETEIRDFAEMANIEYILIDEFTKINDFKTNLLNSDIIWKLKGLK